MYANAPISLAVRLACNEMKECVARMTCLYMYIRIMVQFHVLGEMFDLSGHFTCP